MEDLPSLQLRLSLDLSSGISLETGLYHDEATEHRVAIRSKASLISAREPSSFHRTWPGAVAFYRSFNIPETPIDVSVP